MTDDIRDGAADAAPSRKRRHPAVEAHLAHRAAHWEFQLADTITRFAGSMTFVWLHVIGFAVWMVFIEPSPWPTLTLIVSLEAIFLSTFVMIGQNRQGAFAQAKADHDYQAQTLELKANTELTRAVHTLVRSNDTNALVKALVAHFGVTPPAQEE